MNSSISKMRDNKALNGMMTRLHVAKIKITPVIEQIVKTTIDYSEHEFKQKLRDCEPLFFVEKVELLRALEANSLLLQVQNSLNLDVSIFENLDNSVTKPNTIVSRSINSLNSLQFETEVEKSIASSMKEVIVNTLTIDSPGSDQSSKVHLDKNMIKRLMVLHENIMGTMDVLQDRQLHTKINPLLKDLELLESMSSGEQTNPKQNNKRPKMDFEFKDNKKSKNSSSKRKPKNRKLIILPPERDKLNAYHPLERLEATDQADTLQEKGPIEKEILTRTSNSEFNNFTHRSHGRTINLDIGQIEYSTTNVDTSRKDKNDKVPNKAEYTKNNETIETYVRIPSTAELNETMGTVFPKSYPEPLPKRRNYSVVIPEEDINIKSISEAKRKLELCLDKLSYIRNYLNATLDSSDGKSGNKMIVRKNKHSKEYLQTTNHKIDIPFENVMHNDVSTDTLLNFGISASEDLHPFEFHQLLRNVLDQIDSMHKMVSDKGKIGISNRPFQFDEAIHDIRDMKHENCNEEYKTNLEHTQNMKNLDDIAKLQNTEINRAEMIICPPRCAKSVLKMLCAEELCHPDSSVKSALNNIGLQNLINSAEPAQCSEVVIINDPRDLPEKPLKPSISSLPLSQSDLAIIQKNVDRMKKMLEC